MSEFIACIVAKNDQTGGGLKAAKAAFRVRRVMYIPVEYKLRHQPDATYRMLQESVLIGQ